MEKYRAIPEGYMRVGELAKQAGVTVRTLQYYDKEGLLSPSAESDGGFRLYTDKDAVRLVQILMMKQIGLNLGEIKRRLPHMDTPTDVMSILTEQAINIRKKIEQLSESLSAIEALREEIALIETVDFKKYSAILMNLQMKNDNYWMLKHFDDEMMESFGEILGSEKTALELIEITNRINKQARDFCKKGIKPESKEGQKFAKAYWEGLMKVYDGDMELMQKMNDMVENLKNDKKLDKNFVAARDFTRQALEIYFLKREGLEMPENAEIIKAAMRADKKATRLQARGLPPESKEAQHLAKAFWTTLMKLTDNNIEILEKSTAKGSKENTYLKQALEIYFKMEEKK
ncbi:MAG: MerR family transcriptional regulator [Defluviitaleaceae bacterium]|nr:MerR family transcriptional regulator [Defluviitaleaceae bacterium]